MRISGGNDDFLTVGSAMADQTKGAPLNNQTDGAEYGKTRANYAGLGDVSDANIKHSKH